MMIKMLSISFFLALFFMLISYFLSLKNKLIFEKLSAFECGFISFHKLRSPFSLRFFLIALIFLIFDIEIIFVLPMTMCNFLSLYSLFSIMTLMIIITYGLIHEWFFGSLSWSL